MLSDQDSVFKRLSLQKGTIYLRTIPGGMVPSNRFPVGVMQWPDWLVRHDLASCLASFSKVTKSPNIHAMKSHSSYPGVNARCSRGCCHCPNPRTDIPDGVILVTEDCHIQQLIEGEHFW